jgi:hypothetical protein
VGGARTAEPSLKRGIGEHWRGVAGSAEVLSVQQISGLFHATVAVRFAPWRGAAVSATVAPAALHRAQRPLRRQSRAMAATSPVYSASSFAVNAVMSTEFMAMRHGGCVALIRSSITRRSWWECHCNTVRTGGGAVKAIDFPPLKPRQKYGSFWTHDRWRRFRFGPWGASHLRLLHHESALNRSACIPRR